MHAPCVPQAPSRCVSPSSAMRSTTGDITSLGSTRSSPRWARSSLPIRKCHCPSEQFAILKTDGLRVGFEGAGGELLDYHNPLRIGGQAMTRSRRRKLARKDVPQRHLILRRTTPVAATLLAAVPMAYAADEVPAEGGRS